MGKINKDEIKRIVKPILILILISFPTLFWDTLIGELGWDVINRTIVILEYVLIITLWVCGAWVITRLVDEILWKKIVEVQLGSPVPKLLKDIVTVVIFGVVISGLLSIVFKFSISGILATSGVIGLIIGLALQSMISDLFSGVVINMDRPFKIGDTVEIDGVCGEVSEVNWRSTFITTFDGFLKIIPNSTVRTTTVTNLDKPKTTSRITIEITLGFSVPTERAFRVLKAGAKGAATQILDDPTIDVKISGMTDYGITYKIKFWVDWNVVSPVVAKSDVYVSILEHLHQSGIEVAYQKQDLYMAKMPNRKLDLDKDCQEIISRVEIFKFMNEEEVSKLSKNLKQLRFEAGSKIIKKGDSGNSMYIVVEGLLYVYSDDSEDRTHFGQIIPGQFFGEMSLFTGEARSASIEAEIDSIVFEINKEDIYPIIENRPEIADIISRIISERRTQNLIAQKQVTKEEAQEETESFGKQVLTKIKGFFKGIFKK